MIICSTVIWAFLIRPYIKRNGRSTGNGANYGWAAITDASIADEISKKNGEHPWFLRLFWFLVLLEFGLPIGGFVIIYSNK
jgi:hypothetical protein